MSIAETLKELHEKATPGRFINNQHYECVHTHSDLVDLRPVLHYSHNNPNAENDAELFVAMRNALPDMLALIAAARRVAQYDWSGNDPDAVGDMDAFLLRLFRLTATQNRAEANA